MIQTLREPLIITSSHFIDSPKRPRTYLLVLLQFILIDQTQERVIWLSVAWRNYLKLIFDSCIRNIIKI